MKKCIFFDLDGTLTDSGPGIIRCAQLALSHYGITEYTPHQLRAFVGPPLRETFPRFGVPEEKVEQAVGLFRQEYNARGKWENTPYPGIKTLLQRLKAAGFRLFVATSKPEEVAIELLTHFGLAPYFEMICGATWDNSRDTKDKVIRYLLDAVGQTQGAVMVGDTEFDVLGAKVHNIPTIGVSWGFGTRESMKKAGAVSVADTMEQLFDILAAQ